MTRPDHLTRFKPTGDKALAKQPISVKLPADVDAVIRSMPDPSTWLRQVICEAAQRDLRSLSEDSE